MSSLGQQCDPKSAPNSAPDATDSEDPLLEDHTQRILANAFLHAIYRDVYSRILVEVPADRYPRTIEIGSGGGFLKEHAPHVTTSDCIAGPKIDRVVDACNLQGAFEASSLDAIVGFNVFHHLPDAVGFLQGAQAVLRSGGRVALVEPWFTPVGQWFYRAIHHEPVLLDPNDWSIQGEGRLGGANSRLPTSVFLDGTQRIAQVAPHLSVIKCLPFHKWLYLFSGGLRLNTRVPGSIAQALLRLDRATSALDGLFGIFGVIVVERN